MSEEYYQKIFSKNLKHYMVINQKSQIDFINDLGFNKSAVSTWCNGTRLPRMDKVDALARYFGINRSDLIEDKSSESLKSFDLRSEEVEFLNKINSLNSLGKNKVLDYVSDLMENEKYRK